MLTLIGATIHRVSRLRTNCFFRFNEILDYIFRLQGGLSFFQTGGQEGILV